MGGQAAGRYRFPARLAPFMTSLLLSIFMCAFVSLIATVKSEGVSPELFGAWMSAWLVSWLLAFPVVLIVMPIVRRIVRAICHPV
ncbi:MAG: DUF2798 domain-containing protein [Alphaproteobacteria bacterium]|nr:DUF2798 domain-containing protein [Alphaproteobacteria bacterium]